MYMPDINIYTATMIANSYNKVVSYSYVKLNFTAVSIMFHLGFILPIITTQRTPQL